MARNVKIKQKNLTRRKNETYVRRGKRPRRMAARERKQLQKKNVF